VTGLNSEDEYYPGCCYSTHAEMDAIQKLKRKNRESNRIILVNILIIRISKTGILNCSKPCLNCLKHIQNLPRYGYRVKYVYYSDENGNIVRRKLDDLIQTSTYVTYRFLKK
jgi:deoxycytidylate deaminase